MNGSGRFHVPATQAAFCQEVLQCGVLHLHRHRWGAGRGTVWLAAWYKSRLCGTDACLKVQLPKGMA